MTLTWADAVAASAAEFHAIEHKHNLLAQREGDTVTSLPKQIASHIRSIDHHRQLTPREIGEQVADFLANITGGSPETRTRMGLFVQRIDPHKTLPPPQIAAAVVGEFNLPYDV